MLALSVRQPFVQLILLGKKRFETRSWKTAYRGPLAMHTSKVFPEATRQLCRREPFRSHLAREGFPHSADLPLGVLLGVVDLVDCVPTESVLAELSESERHYGDFRPGRWAWQFANPRFLSQPQSARGQRGLFSVALEE